MMGQIIAWLVLLAFAAVNVQAILSCDYQPLRPSADNDGILTSVGYPERYATGQCLIWSFTGVPGMKVTIKILDLDIPTHHALCDNDFLLIGPLQQQRYCGNSDTQIFEPYEAEMTGIQHLVYILLNSTTTGMKGSGFKLYYKFTDAPSSVSESPSDVPTTSVTEQVTHVPVNDTRKSRLGPQMTLAETNNCRFLLSAATGEVWSNGSLYNIMSQTRQCSWLLHSPRMAGHLVSYRLDFIRCNLRPNDVLRVYDGPTYSDQIIGSYDTIDCPNFLLSTGPSVLISYIPNYQWLNKDGPADLSIQFTSNIQCAPGFLFCGHGEMGCYKTSKRCDGLWDCPLHGGDERGCAECPSNEFSCNSTMGSCYRESDRCNGKGACTNYMDEMGCTPEECSPARALFLCRNKRCIYENWHCDHTNDCRDNSDEEGCSTTSSPRIIVAAVTGALASSLLLVVALGCMCKVYNLRVHQLRGNPHHETPLTRLQAEMFRHRIPPPPYHEAMLTSRPYQELINQDLPEVQGNGSSDHAPSGTRPLSGLRQSRRHRNRRCRHSSRRGTSGHSRSTASGNRTDSVRATDEALLTSHDNPAALWDYTGECQPVYTSPDGGAGIQLPPYSLQDPAARAAMNEPDSTSESDVEGSESVGEEEEEDNWVSRIRNADSRNDVDDNDDNNILVPDICDQFSPDMETAAAVSEPLQSSFTPQNFTSQLGNTYHSNDEPSVAQHAPGGDDKDAEVASASLSIDSEPEPSLKENGDKSENIMQVIESDSDSDCILATHEGEDMCDDDDDDDVDDEDETDSDTACLLSH